MASFFQLNRLLDKLSGGDLRSIGNANAIAKQVRSQNQFDKLFEALFQPDRLIVMRAADAIEKITRRDAMFLQPHRKSLLTLLKTADHKELKWHLALLMARLKLNRAELGKAWATLTRWALDTNESRIVRVNSIQTLFDLSKRLPALRDDLELTLSELQREDIPSITARIGKLREHRG